MLMSFLKLIRHFLCWKHLSLFNELLKRNFKHLTSKVWFRFWSHFVILRRLKLLLLTLRFVWLIIISICIWNLLDLWKIQAWTWHERSHNTSGWWINGLKRLKLTSLFVSFLKKLTISISRRHTNWRNIWILLTKSLFRLF